MLVHIATYGVSNMDCIQPGDRQSPCDYRAMINTIFPSSNYCRALSYEELWILSIVPQEVKLKEKVITKCESRRSTIEVPMNATYMHLGELGYIRPVSG